MWYKESRSHPDGQVDCLGGRHVAGHAARGVPAVDRQEHHIQRPFAQLLGQPRVAHAIAAVVDPQPLSLNQEPEIKMPALRVGVEPFVQKIMTGVIIPVAVLLRRVGRAK